MVDANWWALIARKLSSHFVDTCIGSFIYLFSKCLWFSSLISSRLQIHQVILHCPWIFVDPHFGLLSAHVEDASSPLSFMTTPEWDCSVPLVHLVFYPLSKPIHLQAKLRLFPFLYTGHKCELKKWCQCNKGRWHGTPVTSADFCPLNLNPKLDVLVHLGSYHKIP